MNPTLRFGYKGPAVQQLQNLLNHYQSAMAKIMPDGVFGQVTRLRVIEFQGQCGLTADGIVGSQTWARLLGTSSTAAGAAGSTGSSAPASPAAQMPPPTGDPAGAPAPAPTASGNGDLSPRRRKVLDVLLPSVLPSAYPEPKFQKLTGGIDLSDPKLPKGFTTCGSLPGFVARSLGGTGYIAYAGLDALRIGGKKHNAWVVADGSSMPRPGDLYGLCQGSDPNSLIVHVGVIVDPSGAQWKTADAGQGQLPQQKACYVTRQFDGTAWTLSGEVSQAGNRPPRRIAGWVDIDAYPFKD